MLSEGWGGSGFVPAGTGANAAGGSERRREPAVVLPQLPSATRLRHGHQPQLVLGRVRGRVTKRNPHPQPPAMGTTPEKTRDAGEGLGAGAVAVTSCSLSPLAGPHGSKRGAWTHGGARTEGKGGEHHPRSPICPLLQRAGPWPGWGHPSTVEGTHGCRSGVMERGSTRARGRDAGGGFSSCRSSSRAWQGGPDPQIFPSVPAGPARTPRATGAPREYPRVPRGTARDAPAPASSTHKRGWNRAGAKP